MLEKGSIQLYDYVILDEEIGSLDGYQINKNYVYKYYTIFSFTFLKNQNGM